MYTINLSASQLISLQEALDVVYDKACEWGDDEFIEELDELYEVLKSAKQKEAI